MEHQTCRICNKTLPKTDEYFYVSKTNLSGFLYQCCECIKARMRAKSSSSTGPKVFLSKAAKEKRDTADKRHKLESGSTYDSEADIIERGLSLLSIDSDDWPVGLDSLDADSDAAWESMCDKALGVTTDEN